MYMASALCDFYKLSHRAQYPDGIEKVYSTWTPRKSLIDGVNHAVAFGFQGFIKEYLIDFFNTNFFNRPKKEVVAEYKRLVTYTLGTQFADTKHIEELHDLGYLPIKIMALPEGTVVPMRVPTLTIENTNHKFAWLTNYLETIMSCELWQSSTSATVAKMYRQILDRYAMETVGNTDGVGFQGHDFSMRGMGSLEAAAKSGAGHILSFTGSDVIPAINYLEDYYNADIEAELVAASVPACYDDETEILTNKGWKLFKNLDKQDLVAQYHTGGLIDFVTPSEYYNMKYTGKMVKFSSGGAKYFDIVVTPNHKMVDYNKTTYSTELYEASNPDFNYSDNKWLIVSGKANDDNIGLSALDKLKIAFQADGSFPNRAEHYTGERVNTIPIRFSLKKQRKIDRLENILEELGCDYSKSEPDNSGYTNFWVKLDIKLQKTFSWIDLSKVSYCWAKEFINELAYWDGCFAHNCICYSSIIKDNVDMVQALVSICGMKGKINSYLDKRTNCNRKTIYSICVSDKCIVGGKLCNKSFIDYDGYVHCVTVPTHKIIVRRGGEVCISGNTEHSVMCSYGKDNEPKTFKRLINDVYPIGIASIVSDTWDLWNVVDTILPALKADIMKRDGKIVIRPDSGNPVDIICGEYPATNDANRTAEQKGLIESLWDIFGGTISDKGYKVLDSHIGALYGDAITIERCEEICKRLKEKGFASTNLVFGIGSYTYQYKTRDSLGYALKSTYVKINGEEKDIFKDPKTDTGHFKKSQTGMVAVVKDDDSFKVVDGLTDEERNQMTTNEMKCIFVDGTLKEDTTLNDIRYRLGTQTV